jgi:hypothetical protein
MTLVYTSKKSGKVFDHAAQIYWLVANEFVLTDCFFRVTVFGNTQERLFFEQVLSLAHYPPLQDRCVYVYMYVRPGMYMAVCACMHV